MNPYPDEFNVNRSVEVAVGAFIAMLAIGAIKVVAQALME